MKNLNNYVESKVVKANAGTGKTFFLAIEYIKCLFKMEKFITNPFNSQENKLLDNKIKNNKKQNNNLNYLKFSEILVITFTKAATSEIRNRILKFINILINYKHLIVNNNNNTVSNNNNGNNNKNNKEWEDRKIFNTIVDQLQEENINLTENSFEFLENIYSNMLTNKHLIMVKTIDSFINYVFKNFVINYHKIGYYEINNQIDEEHSQKVLDLFLAELIKKVINSREKDNDFYTLVNYFITEKNIAKNYSDLKYLFKNIFNYGFLILLLDSQQNYETHRSKLNNQHEIVLKKREIIVKFIEILEKELINLNSKINELQKDFTLYDLFVSPIKEFLIKYFLLVKQNDELYYFEDDKNFKNGKSGRIKKINIEFIFKNKEESRSIDFLINLFGEYSIKGNEAFDNSKYYTNLEILYNDFKKLILNYLDPLNNKTQIFSLRSLKKLEDFEFMLYKNIMKKIYPLMLEIEQSQILLHGRYLTDLFSLIIKEYLKFKEKNPEFTYNDIATLTYETLYSPESGLIEELYLQNGVKIKTVTNQFYEFLSSKFRFILIDEFQDTSIIQWKILFPIIVEILSGEGVKNYGKVVVVGDEKQSIYGWRGGEKKLFDVVENYCKKLYKKDNGKESILNKTYRNKKNIVDFVNSLYSYVSQLKTINYNYVKTEIGTDSADNGFVNVSIKKYKRNAKDNVTYEQQIESFLEENFLPFKNRFSFSNTAIIARTNKDLQIVSDFLSKNNISYIIQSKKSIFEYKLVKPFIFLLDFIIYEDFFNLLKFLRSCYINISEEEVKLFAIAYKIAKEKFEDINFNYKNYSKTKEESEYDYHANLIYKLNYLKNTINNLEKEPFFINGIKNYNIQIYKNNLINILNKIESFLKSISLSDDIPFLIKKIYKEFIKKRTIKDVVLAESDFDILNKFYEIALAFHSNKTSSIKTLKEFLNFIKENIKNEKFNIELKANANAVNLLTIHGSKGLEYDNVFAILTFKNKTNQYYSDDGGSKLKINAFYDFNDSLSEINANSFYLLFNESEWFIRKNMLLYLKNNNGINDYLEKYPHVKRLIELMKKSIKKEVEEEFNNIYVAITRARNYLNILLNVPDSYFNETENSYSDYSNSEISLFKDQKKYLFFTIYNGIEKWREKFKLDKSIGNINYDTKKMEKINGKIDWVDNNKNFKILNYDIKVNKNKVDWIQENFLNHNYSELSTVNIQNKNTDIRSKIENYKTNQIFKGVVIHYYLSHILLPFNNKIDLRNNLSKESSENQYLENNSIKLEIIKIKKFFQFAKNLTYFKFGNLFSKEFLDDILDKLDIWIVNNKNYYNSSLWDKVFNEFTIYDENKKMYRIDRIMINEKNKEVFIIDYKTGEKEYDPYVILEHKNILLDSNHFIEQLYPEERLNNNIKDDKNQIERYIDILKNYKIFKKNKYKFKGQFVNIKIQ